MIVDNDDVETKIRLLVENAANRIENRLLAVSNGDDHTRLYRKVIGTGWNRLEARLEVRPHAFQVFGRDVFHFDLVNAVARIHVIELLLPGGPEIRQRSCV